MRQSQCAAEKLYEPNWSGRTLATQSGYCFETQTRRKGWRQFPQPVERPRCCSVYLRTSDCTSRRAQPPSPMSVANFSPSSRTRTIVRRILCYT